MASALRAGTYMTPARDRPPEPLQRRTFAAVHRNSLLRGGVWEADWTAKMGADEADGIRNAIRTLLLRLRADGGKSGRRRPLARISIELVKLMGWFFKKTGRFEMTLAEMAERVGCSISTVNTHLRRLRDELKCLVWQRRMVPTGRAGERGPQYEQTSSLYRLVPLPAKVMTLIHGKRPPRPEDEDARLADRVAEALRMDGQAHAIGLKDQEERSPAIAVAAAKARRQLTTAAKVAGGLEGEVVEWEDWMEFVDTPDPHCRT